MTQHDSLAWLSAVLWPDGSARLVPEHRRRSPGGSMQWWASPSIGQPTILIPADCGAAARRAVRRYHDGFDLGQWSRRVAAESAMTAPWLVRRVLADRVITIDGPADALDRGVLGGLRDVLERDDLRFAVTLARPKSNRKPVIQILDDRGMVVGWAKVGWNQWTEDLVANEASWLSRTAWPPLIMPVLLHDAVLAGQRVVVTSSVNPGRRPSRNRPKPGCRPDPRVLNAIADLGSTATASIRDSAWWMSVETILHAAEPRELAAIDHVLTQAGDREFGLGAWHGDFAPWNVMTVRGMAQVIDWEFAADQVPLGFDLCHYHTQVAGELLGRTPTEALDYSARLSPRGLSELGVDPANRIATWNLYLVELIRRTISLRAAGMSTDDVNHGRAAVDRLGHVPQPGPVAPTTGANRKDR